MRGFEPVRMTMRKNYNIIPKGEVLDGTVLEFPMREYSEIQLPTRADAGSAGYDFYSPVTIGIEPQQMVLIWTDIKACMLPDEVLELHMRSSLGVKHGIVLANGTGIIDSSYFNNIDNDGNIGVPLYNMSDEVYVVTKGDKIAQGIFSKYLTTVDDVVVGQSRAGGFGSSGK